MKTIALRVEPDDSNPLPRASMAQAWRNETADLQFKTLKSNEVRRSADALQDRGPAGGAEEGMTVLLMTALLRRSVRPTERSDVITKLTLA